MLDAHRSSILHLLGDPTSIPEDEAYQYYEDGLLVINEGRVVEVGSADRLLLSLPKDTNVINHSNTLLLPGFIDTHIHFPQSEIIAAHGKQLMDWLNELVFPAESKYGNKDYAELMADMFINQLLRNGTTTASVFCSVHPESVDALFEKCHEKNLRMIAGKVMMDRNCPVNLRDSAETSYRESKKLIERWHNRGRLRYAITPRFAVTSSPSQLGQVRQLMLEHPDAYLQTHLSENQDEISLVRKLFPEYKSYLDVYDQYGLLSQRSIFAHCLHLGIDEWHRLSETQSNIAFCPSSNLFLGNGLFPLEKAEERTINVGIGSDIGGGNNFSILQTLGDAYKVVQLRKEQMSPMKGIYLATLGGARTLGLSDKIGNFLPGKEADFVCLDKGATPLLKMRIEKCEDLWAEIFALSMLGDDRVVKQTWITGAKLHDRDVK